MHIFRLLQWDRKFNKLPKFGKAYIQLDGCKYYVFSWLKWDWHIFIGQPQGIYGKVAEIAEYRWTEDRENIVAKPV